MFYLNDNGAISDTTALRDQRQHYQHTNEDGMVDVDINQPMPSTTIPTLLQDDETTDTKRDQTDKTIIYSVLPTGPATHTGEYDALPFRTETAGAMMAGAQAMRKKAGIPKTKRVTDAERQQRAQQIVKVHTSPAGVRSEYDVVRVPPLGVTVSTDTEVADVTTDKEDDDTSKSNSPKRKQYDQTTDPLYK